MPALARIARSRSRADRRLAIAGSSNWRRIRGWRSVVRSSRPTGSASVTPSTGWGTIVPKTCTPNVRDEPRTNVRSRSAALDRPMVSDVANIGSAGSSRSPAT